MISQLLISSPWFAALATAFGVSTSLAQTTLFSDNFDGGTGDLNGTTPDTGGVNWVATPTNFLANGTIGGTGGGTATLAFTPVNGLIYTLDASFTGITGDGNWIAFGFVNGQGTSSATSGGSENRFLENQTVGIAWMLARGNNGTNPNVAFLGNGNVGNSDGTDWSGGPTNGGNMDLRVVLDTTGGTGNWTATWYAKQDTDGSYTTIRGTTGLLDESITSVGFGKSNTGISGTIESFSLSSVNTLDSDGDGLDDSWEVLHFRVSAGESDATILAKYDGTDDPDNDTFDNEAEETAGTDPNDPSHTPLDADQDGYGDAWELATFGTTDYGPSDDPDGDGATTAEELAAGSDPADSFSSPSDTDADGMDDAAEMAAFGNLDQGPLDDFDGDGVPNHGELAAGTDPANPGDYPLVSFIPVTDGNAATDENGYAGVAINSVAFIQDNLLTVGGQQFIAYYRRHATDSAHPDNETIIIGRRNVGELRWEAFTTSLTSYNIDDRHNTISFGIDGDGLLHMSWGMHGVHDPGPMLYARSTGSVLGSAQIVMNSLGPGGMTGQENTVTYPKFLPLPDGDLLFLFREGPYGNSDWYLSRYDIATDTWTPVHANGGGTHLPFMKGTGDSPPNCFYPDRMTLGPDGMLHLSGPFRYRPENSPAGEQGLQTNHRYVYLRSPDEGVTWQRTDGTTIDLPAVEKTGFAGYAASHVPEIIEDFPEGYSIINESGMTTDSAGRPVIANWWADDAGSGDNTRQYHIFFHDGSTWHKRTVSARDIDDPATKFGVSGGGDLGSSRMSRPVVLTDADDRIIVVYADNRFIGITVVFSEPLAQDPGRNNWTRMSLTSENLGLWEPTYDEQRWKQDGVLHMLYQKLPNSSVGIDYNGQNDSTPVSVIEWNAHAYFNSPIHWKMDTTTTPGQAAFSAPTRTGFRYDLRTSTDLDFSDPPATSLPGNGAWRDFGTWPTNEARRFWQLERIEEATGDL